MFRMNRNKVLQKISVYNNICTHNMDTWISANYIFIPFKILFYATFKISHISQTFTMKNKGNK